MKKTLIYILLTLSSVFWGISFIMTKELFISEPNITVTIIITLRLAIASAVMVPTLALTRRLQPIRKPDIKWFLLLSLAEPFLYNLCETSALQLVSGSLASVIVATIPLLVPFSMAAVYRKPIGTPMLIGVILSFIGVAVMLLGGENLTVSTARGLLYMAGAVIIAIIFTLILVKIVDHYEPFTITTYQNLFGFIYYLPLMLLTDSAHLPLLSYSPKMLSLLLTLGICCSTLAYVLYNFGVRALGASEACIFNNTIPIFSLIAAIAIGQEQFSIWKIIGIAVVIAGVIISQQKTSPKP